MSGQEGNGVDRQAPERRRAALAALALVLLVSVSLDLGPAGAARDDPRAKGRGGPTLAKAIPRLQHKAQSRWPDSFAGMWVGVGGGAGKERSFGIEPLSLSLRAGKRRTVALDFEDADAVGALKRLLKRRAYRRGSLASVSVRAADAAGNSTMRELELMLGREGKRRSAEAGRADPLAAVRLGQVAPDDPADCGAPSNLVQASTGPSPTYRVPVDGAITRWSHAGDPGAAGSGRLQVWRPAGGTSYRLVGNSAVRTFAPGLNTFATSIRVRAGDLLGLRGGAEAGCMFSGEVGDLVRGDGPGAGDPAPGATRDMSIDEPELRVNVAATLEPDDRLALDVDAAARQTPEKLAVTLSCPEEACEAEISGAAVARRKSARKRAFVAFTEKAKRRVAKLGRGFPKPGRLKPVTVQHSLRELEDLQGRMIADREQFRATGPPFPGVRRQELYDLDIDVIRNAPVVILEHPTDAAASSFRARYGPEVIVEAGEPAEPHVLYPCKSRFVCYDLRSGLETTWVKSAPKGAGCTTAFTAFGSKEHNAPLGILSAAHCGGPNPKDPDSDLGVGPRFHSTERSRYGTVQKEQLLGPLDAEWHSVNYEPFKSLKPSALIYVDDTERGGKVKRVGKFDELVIGESRLCKSGITTGKGGCGRVKSLNYSPSYVPWSGQFVKADYCAQPGDSGAGVYAKIPGLKLPPGSANSYTAVGIHSGGAKDTPCRSTKFYTLFGHIEFVEKQLEVRVPLAK